MLKPVQSKVNRQRGVRFAIVASRYNARYVDAMLKAARREFKRAGATVKVVRVPGAFEIPAVAAKLAACPSPGYAAIVCFGVIFQGQTSHAQHIGWGVTHALAQIQVLHRLPVVHAVFVFEQEEHARVRCLGRTHNRGTEAARTALEMGLVCARLTQKKPNGTD
jgi:6,7-dimethyl-8-ribityllumazine synthase